MTADEYKMNIKTMIKLILNRYFKTNACLVSSVISHLPKPSLRVQRLANKLYKGPDSKFK